MRTHKHMSPTVILAIALGGTIFTLGCGELDDARSCHEDPGAPDGVACFDPGLTSAGESPSAALSTGGICPGASNFEAWVLGCDNYGGGSGGGGGMGGAPSGGSYPSACYSYYDDGCSGTVCATFNAWMFAERCNGHNIVESGQCTNYGSYMRCVTESNDRVIVYKR